MKNLRVRLTFLILLSAGISVGVVLSRALETHAVGVTQSPLTQRTNFSHVPASPPFSNIEVLERARRGEIPAYAGGDNGVAFILFVDAAGTRSLSHVRTSMPVHKVFGLLTESGKLVYSPLRNRSPSGALMIEDLDSGTHTQLIPDVVVSATVSPTQKTIAFTYSASDGFGLGMLDLDSGKRTTLTSKEVLADFLEWDETGSNILYFETNTSSGRTMVLPKRISVSEGSHSIVGNGDPLSRYFPRYSPRPQTDPDLRDEQLSGHAEFSYPFQMDLPERHDRLCGENFFGGGAIELCDAGGRPEFRLVTGQLLRITTTGIIVRFFDEDRTAIEFVDWKGEATRLAVSPQVTYHLPLSKTAPNSGSFLVTRSGSGYGGNACTLVGSLHTGNLQFAFDMQKTGTVGQHVLASADGLVVYSVENINCNSCDNDGCGSTYCPGEANGGWGNTVVIEHADGTWSKYSHMQFNSVQVDVGANACLGQYIGNQGHTGCSAGNYNGCGDHLHYQKQSGSGRDSSSISASFNDASTNPLSCTNHTTASTEVSSCVTCSNVTSTQRNRDNGPPVHPPGTVVKTSTSSTVYLLDPEGRRRPITSAAVLSQLYNQSTDARTNTNFSNWVITIPQDEMNLYEVGGNISAALPGNGKPFPDGKLIRNNAGEIAIVTGGGRKRPFTDFTRLQNMGYAACNIVTISDSDYNSYASGPPVDAMPVLTGSVTLSPAGPYIVGQNINGSFMIKNVGFASFQMDPIVLGATVNGTCCSDMTSRIKTLTAGETFEYTGSRNLDQSSTWNFFAAHRETNGHWTSYLPALSGVVRSRQITVSTVSSSSIQFSSANYSVIENGGNATITVTRSGGSSAVSVNYTTSNGTATAGSDYTAVSGTLNFASGDNSETFTVPITNDTGVESNETVNLTLTNPSSGAVLGSPNTAVLTILDDDVSCPSPTIITLGDSRGGFLQAGDCLYTDGSYYDAYTFSGTAGQQIYITLNSTQFNAYLFLFQGVYPGGGMIAQDNDGNGGTNARIPAGSGFFTLPANGSYTILANSLSAGETGSYTMTLGSSDPANSAPFDFDSDNKTDIGIFRPSNGQWWIQYSSSSQTFAAAFGVSTDRIVPADYTGDGRTDMAVWRPASGEWFVLRSEDNSFYSAPFGANGDTPVPSDYDDDGRADLAVFRPSNATWFIVRSGGGTTIQTFGANGDQPAPADYDGDGRADIGIYRPSNGQWWLNRTSAGLVVLVFGNSTDKIVPADYTGDGKSDAALWRPSTGQWFVLRSEDLSFYSAPFGTTGDTPAPGDYDADGRYDVAVFRPSNATWFIQRSTAGTLIRQFGLSGDRPIPSAFVP